MSKLEEIIVGGNILSVSYDRALMTMYIVFEDKSVYSYYPVKRISYSEFARSQNVWNYYKHHIKDRSWFKVKKIE
jgi:hypothetical protein